VVEQSEVLCLEAEVGRFLETIVNYNDNMSFDYYKLVCVGDYQGDMCDLFEDFGRGIVGSILIRKDLIGARKRFIEEMTSNINKISIAELKGIANIIPNQEILVNAIVLREAKDSSEIENIATTQDEIYKAITLSAQKTVDSAAKELIRYREAL
jgi:hypothetical protein